MRLWVIFLFNITLVGIKNKKHFKRNLKKKKKLGHKTKHIFRKSSMEEMRLLVIFIGNIPIGGIKNQKTFLRINFYLKNFQHNLKK